MRWTAVLGALLLAGCGGGSTEPDSPAAGKAGAAKTVRLTHAKSGFSIRAPRGFSLKVHDGVYVLRDGERSMSFSRAVTDATPEAYGKALLKQIGGDAGLERGDAGEFNAEADRDGVRNTIVVVADAGGLYAVTARSPDDRPLPIDAVQLAGASAKGGYRLEPPPAKPQEIELVPYRAPDATALVPQGWSVNSNQGSLEGSSDDGSFLFGYSVDVLLPENAPAGAENYSTLIAPYTDPGAAIAELFPKIATQISDVEITNVTQEGILPGFSQSAMYQFDYLVNGKPWTGAAMAATDSPEKYSNYTWKLYYSGIGLPKGSDPAVGAGLLHTWRSWDPSGGIAQRTAQQKELLDSTNAIWKETSEFRGRQADRQSRDVGCLLQGYYDVEDNSRKYDLPPLPCDQEYVP